MLVAWECALDICHRPDFVQLLVDLELFVVLAGGEAEFVASPAGDEGVVHRTWEDLLADGIYSRRLGAGPDHDFVVFDQHG